MSTKIASKLFVLYIGLELHQSVFLIAFLFFYHYNFLPEEIIDVPIKGLQTTTESIIKPNYVTLLQPFTVFLVTKKNYQPVPHDLGHSQIFVFISGFAIKKIL